MTTSKPRPISTLLTEVKNKWLAQSPDDGKATYLCTAIDNYRCTLDNPTEVAYLSGVLRYIQRTLIYPHFSVQRWLIYEADVLVDDAYNLKYIVPYKQAWLSHLIQEYIHKEAAYEQTYPKTSS